MKTTIEECKDFFESIMCLCVEGPEFHTKMELADVICQKATKGYDLCRSVEQGDSADAYCVACDWGHHESHHDFCHKCGKPLTAPQQADSADAQSRCVECGSEVSGNFNLCDDCGKQLSRR